MKKLLKVLLTILIVGILAGAGGIFYITRGLASGKQVVLSGVSPGSLQDGAYPGTYTAGRWTNELLVIVQAGKITEIRMVRDVVFPQEGLSADLFRRVIDSQNTDVDIMSGATVTGKAYLKAIENALNENPVS